MITFEKIVEKLGFNPLEPSNRSVDEDPSDPDWLKVDDNTPSPCSVLTDEESRWLYEYICKQLRP